MAGRSVTSTCKPQLDSTLDLSLSSHFVASILIEELSRSSSPITSTRITSPYAAAAHGQHGIQRVPTTKGRRRRLVPQPFISSSITWRSAQSASYAWSIVTILE